MGKMQEFIDAGLLVSPLVVTDAAYQMKAGDQFIYANAADNVVVLTLPPMAVAVGKMYYIQALDVSNDVSVNVHETATEISTYGDLDATDDAIGYFCTGEDWQQIFENVA